MPNYNFEQRRNRLWEPAQLLSEFNVLTPHIRQQNMLGAIFDLNDGRRYRYCKNGAVALAKAIMAQSSVPIAGNTEEVNTNGTAAIVGDTRLTIGLTTTVTEDVLVDGFL